MIQTFKFDSQDVSSVRFKGIVVIESRNPKSQDNFGNFSMKTYMFTYVLHLA